MTDEHRKDTRLEKRLRLGMGAYWLALVLQIALLGRAVWLFVAERAPIDLVMVLAGALGLGAWLFLRYGPGRFYHPDSVRRRLEETRG